MATDLQPRKTTRAATALQRKFADLCARIRRVDLVAHFLALTLIVLGYAFLIGAFDWFAGNSTALSVRATRWIGFGAFTAAFLFACVQTIRCLLREVSPYYVAHQLEQALPDSKNTLINWLDLHEDDLPSAFQKNLSARAEEQMNEADADQTIRTRKNWVLLGSLGVPALGLLVLLILGPTALAKSLLRGFVPMYTPATLSRTEITLVQPEGGDAEVGVAQAIVFVAKIEGRVPTGNRPDAPTLHFRYQRDEDYRTRPLQSDGGGEWTATLQSAEIRAGFTYKITAGDAETPAYEVRVRGPAHVRQFEIAYEHKSYRKLRNRTDIYANTPAIHGPRGSEVEVIVRTSRPVKSASVEIASAGGKRELPGRAIDPQSFACRWMLEQPGQFRVLFTTPDGEDNSDRDWHPIQVNDDEAPTVVLKKPGKDITLAENGTLVLEGHARSDVGIKNLTLHLRVLNDANEPMFPPRPYRPEQPLRFDDGTYPNEVPYLEVVGMDEFKRDGIPHRLAAGTVIEYWLEAADCTDVPDPKGRIGKSEVYKITLTAATDAKQAAADRQNALNRQQEHAKKQAGDHAKKNQENKNGGGGAKSDPRQELKKNANERKDTENKLGQADKEKSDNDNRGGVKPGDASNADKKDGPQPGGDGGAKEKNQPPMTGDESGASKDQGGGAGGTSKDSGTKKTEPKENASKGDRKDAPKETSTPAKDAGAKGAPEPSASVKDDGDMGMNAPMPAPAKPADPAGPTPIAKGDKKADGPADGPPQGDVKGVEQNGPDLPHKGAQGGASAPEIPSKGGAMTMDDAGAAKDGAGQGSAGKARGDEPKTGKQEIPWPVIADLHDQLANKDTSDDAANDAARKFADIARNSGDAAKRDLAREILSKNGRDPKTGEKKKGPNPFGSGGAKSGELPFEVKLAVANREFAAKIGQMQLDDWKKRLTPDLLRKAGLSEADWQRYVKNMQAYDALVRQVNAEQIRAAHKRGQGGALPNAGARQVEGAGAASDTLDGGRVVPPPELTEPHRRFAERKQNN